MGRKIKIFKLKKCHLVKAIKRGQSSCFKCGFELTPGEDVVSRCVASNTRGSSGTKSHIRSMTHGTIRVLYHWSCAEVIGLV